MDGPVSRIEWVEDQLRRALLSGDLIPGERLLTAQLAERFNVSPTPLREALHRLSGEGLVEFVPQRGARVTKLSPTENVELTFLRELLEPKCVTNAIAHNHGSWLEAIERSSAELMDRWLCTPHDSQASELAYQAFYEHLTSTCASSRLLRYASSIRNQHSRYRLAMIDSTNRFELRTIHLDLIQAAREGDASGSEEAVVREVRYFASGYSHQLSAAEAP